MSNPKPEPSPPPPPPPFDPTKPSLPISYPIKTLQQLESRSYFDSFHYPFNKATFPIQNGSFGLPNRRRMLVCHDMGGGYLDDKWVQGGTNSDAYAIWHWNLIDVFVYFSHSLVTLPPPTWINTAHHHGVKVLGTFITEWDEGRAACDTLLSTKESAQMYAERLVELASALGFDGWLINMEVNLDKGQISNLKEFVNHLSITMHSAVPGSLVLWYDSVTIDGKLDWQDQLNEHNKAFFDICDGIFVNYTWKEDYPRLSAVVAGDRKFDVYMGIDVFGRNTYGGGQWNANVALDVIRKDDVSAAIFAPGWVYETKQPPNFETAQNSWWGLVEKSWGLLRNYPGVLPFYTNFDQPLLQLADPTDSIQVLVDLKESSYFGGGNLTFVGSLEEHAYFERKIFQGEFLLSELPIHFVYSVKSNGNSSLGLKLEFTSSNNKNMSILLASEAANKFSNKFSKIITVREQKNISPGWVLNESIVARNGYTLKEIHAVCYRSDHNDSTVASPSDYSAVLGHITIKPLGYKPDFPASKSWLVDGEYIKWTSGPQGSKILNVKLSWKLEDGNDYYIFPSYNLYLVKLSKEEEYSNQGTTIEHVKEYLGVAHVTCFYVSDIEVPSGISCLKFIIQACNDDGTIQEFDESPYYQLEVEGS
ncbi:hypothetical protein TanjilG_16197 [Lupinus angustifolius]|uniref:mannosyl-glycoprotein endo-beta-N-acetylglucosaminidase n=1 Tax=Lupinus angustifolius TaxID=3871 RepID=A0A1J7H6U8_LUPAN|nr:hypothetical protein TanjilG_16197 [Lupinus angustifolius]